MSAEDFADRSEAEYQHTQAWPTLCVSRSGVMRRGHELDKDLRCVYCDIRPEDWK